jgi:transposase
VHSRYRRMLADAPAGGQRVMIELVVRRFFCGNPGCPAKTFAEQVAGLTTRHARRTPLLRGMLEAIALELAGRAGQRLAEVLGLPASRSTLLRLIGALPDPECGAAPAVTGVDDFAFRRGCVYGTILVNAATGDVVDLLPDRQTDTFAQWLKDHPGAEVICRDRAGAYAEGASTGAPDAIQVADRWHLWHNLAGYVEKAAARHSTCLKDPAPEPTPEPVGELAPRAADTAQTGLAAVPGQPGLATRTADRHAAVHALLGQGKNLAQICRELGLSRGTVRRFARAADPGELTGPRASRPSQLDKHRDYLHQRFGEDCTNATVLFTELRNRGYRGSYGTVKRYVRPFRTLGTAPPPAPKPPTTREVSRLILTDPANLDEQDKAVLTKIRDRCPDLNTIATSVTEFAKMITQLDGDHLDDWITTAQATGSPDLASFTNGLLSDYDAVRNGLTLTWNSGTVEGNVNRVKMIKRQMYGRAGFTLLRKRVLLTGKPP